jgi:hypothetical protein
MKHRIMTTTRKQREGETDEINANCRGGEEGSMQIRDMYSRDQALAVLAVDTLKHAGRD